IYGFVARCRDFYSIVPWLDVGKDVKASIVRVGINFAVAFNVHQLDSRSRNGCTGDIGNPSRQGGSIHLSECRSTKAEGCQPGEEMRTFRILNSDSEHTSNCKPAKF